MSAHQRRKGAAGERELAAELSAQLGIEIKRVLGQARDGGFDIRVGPFAVEVKRRKRIGLVYEASGQAEESTNKPPFQTPVIAMRADGKDWLVTLRLCDFIKLAREEI